MKMMTAMYTMKKGGSYDRFIMMLEAFLERSCEVYCLSLTPIQVENTSFYNYVPWYPFRNKGSLMAKLAVLFFFPLWSIWINWRHKIDLIIAFGSLYAFLLSFSKGLFQRRMVTFIRGNYSFGLRMQNSSAVSLLLNRIVEYGGLVFSDKIITNNSAAQDEILKNLKKRKNIDVQVLYNNIPPTTIQEKQDILQTRNKYAIPENAKILVTAGILNRGKNVESLIRCLPQIGMENIYLLVVGIGLTEADFRYWDSLQVLVKELRVEKEVIFTGWLNKGDLYKIYCASDLFILPSLDEGMPNAMLEALGAGLPCMGSDIPGIRDILQHGELLFDPRDEKTLTIRVERFFSEGQFFDKVKTLCQEKKKVFEFDWKDRMFQMATKRLDCVPKKS